MGGGEEEGGGIFIDFRSSREVLKSLLKSFMCSLIKNLRRRGGEGEEGRGGEGRGGEGRGGEGRGGEGIRV